MFQILNSLCMELKFTPDIEARLTERAACQQLHPDEVSRTLVSRYFREEDRYVEAIRRGEAALDR